MLARSETSLFAGGTGFGAWSFLGFALLDRLLTLFTQDKNG